MNSQNKYNRILIIRTGAIGDVVHTTNVIRSIKNFNQNAQIDYIVGKGAAALLKNDKDLKNVYVLEKKGYEYLFKLAKELKKNKYDLIINLQSSLRFKFLSWCVGAKKILTFKKNMKQHAVINFFKTAQKVMPELECPNDLKLYLDEKLKEKFAQKFKTDKKIVILNTQATRARFGRKWKIENYFELTKKLIKKYNCKIIIPGTDKELLQFAHFTQMHDNVDVIAGEYSLEESAAIFSLADLFISGDTGPLHIASALDKPICIGLYGSIPVTRCSPWGKKHHAINANLKCVACHKKRCKYQKKDYTPCMNAISVEQVLELIERNNLL